MIALLLAVLLTQGLPPLPGRSGSVSGVLRTAAGMPAARVRIAAMVPPEPGTDIAAASAFSALTETDENGRYTLDGIPPGRYYVVAGRLDLPTFYPGTADIAQARAFVIPPDGGAVTGIEFAIQDNSVRSATNSNVLDALLLAQSQLIRSTATTFSIPLRARVEDGGKLPVFWGGDFVTVRLTGLGSSNEPVVSIGSPSGFMIPLTVAPAAPEFRVLVDNLPLGYVVKSMMYGTDNVMNAPLKIPAANLPRVTVVTLAGVTQQVITTVSAAGAAAPTLEVVLAKVPLPPGTGVRVRGKISDGVLRGVYLSGIPGTYFEDGSFEFQSVPPGKHRFAGMGSPPAVASWAALVSVGDRDMEGLVPEVTATLPADAKTPVQPGMPDSRAAGVVLKLPNLYGRLEEEVSGKPVDEGGAVRLIGRNSVEATLGMDGQFTFEHLLPGAYTIEIRIFGHTNVSLPVVIGEEDLRLVALTRKMY